jgi:hypothetical protein
MDTNFVNVKLGQKISIKGMKGTYVVIRIQQANTTSDQTNMIGSMKIEAIPAYDAEGTEKYIPPVEPVPVIRKSGPQTAFIADNEDPKFQGRVRVAYPWQSLKGALKVELSSAGQSLAEAKAEKKRLEDKKQQLPLRMIRLQEETEELIRYCNASKEEREKMLSEKAQKRADLESDIEDLQKERAELEKKKAETDRRIGEKEAELAAMKKDPKTSKSDIEQKKLELESYMSEALDDDIKKIDAKIAQKQQEIEKSKEEETEMKAAAEDHSVIVRKKQAYDQAVKDNETIDEELETANDKVKDNQ